MRYETGVAKVCQILSRSTENSRHSINIWDTVTKMLPLCSLYQASSYEPSLTLLAWFLSEFAHLSMLFVLEVVCTANRRTLWEMVRSLVKQKSVFLGIFTTGCAYCDSVFPLCVFRSPDETQLGKQAKDLSKQAVLICLNQVWLQRELNYITFNTYMQLTWISEMNITVNHRNLISCDDSQKIS